MTIYCDYPRQFFDAIKELVTRGLTFEADSNTYTIKLTGGY